MKNFLNPHQTRRIAWLLCLILFISGLIVGVQSIRNFNRAAIVVEWETASELDTVGYNILRGESEDGPFTHFTIPADWHEEILASYLNDDGMAAFERENYNFHQELLRLRNLYSLGYITLADFQVRGTVIQQQLNQLQLSTRSEASEILPLLEDFSALWDKLDAVEKRLILGTIFANFFFDGQGKLRWVQTHTPFDRLLGLPEGGAMFE